MGKPMRVHLRHISSGLLFQEPDQWTAEMEKARAFRHSAEAMDLARHKGLREVEVLLTFEEPRSSVGLALPPQGLTEARRH
jgi:hypothetical protein